MPQMMLYFRGRCNMAGVWPARCAAPDEMNDDKNTVNGSARADRKDR